MNNTSMAPLADVTLPTSFTSNNDSSNTSNSIDQLEPSSPKAQLNQLLLADFLTAQVADNNQTLVAQLPREFQTPGDNSGVRPGDSTEETIVINGQKVKIKSAENAPDGSRIIVIAEEFGVNPAGTKINWFDRETFPTGRPSKYGALLAIAEHPSGNKVYTKHNGNTVFELAKPLKTNYPGGAFESKLFEELPDGTQIWRTTDGATVERFSKGSMTTARGNIARIDMRGSELTYLTEDGKTFSVKQEAGKLMLGDVENGKTTKPFKIDSFVESFRPPYNHPYYGAVNSRTRTVNDIRLDLGNRGECTIYMNPPKYDDKRTTHSIIYNAANGTTQSWLSDGSIINRRIALGDRDWVKLETSQSGEKTYFYKNGDSLRNTRSGERIETYVNGLPTSLEGKVVAVNRNTERNVYQLADGDKVEMKLRGGHPLIKTSPDGKQQVIKGDSVKEHYPAGNQTAYGVVKTVETKNSGEITYWLPEKHEFARVTVLLDERHGYGGFVTLKDGSNRLVTASGMILDHLPLDEKGVRDHLSGTVRQHNLDAWIANPPRGSRYVWRTPGPGGFRPRK